MTVVIMILAIIFGLMLEQFWPSSVFMGFGRPPLLAGIVAYFALNRSAPMMLSAALFGGILNDGISSLPLGVTALALAVSGSVLHYYRDTVFSGKLVTNIVFGAGIGVSMILITFSLFMFLGQTPYYLQPRLLFLKIIFTMIYGAVSFPVIYILLERLELLTGSCLRDRFPDDTHSNN